MENKSLRHIKMAQADVFVAKSLLVTLQRTRRDHERCPRVKGFSRRDAVLCRRGEPITVHCAKNPVQLDKVVAHAQRIEKAERDTIHSR